VGVLGLLGYLAYLRFGVYCKIKPIMQAHFDPAFWQTSLVFVVVFIALTFFALPLALPQTKIGTLYPFRRSR
jgi:ABC-type Na+ efflux pump permease subunit